jgi:HTH-type transcriptional regulator, transcriptional repressor of NAD biosynthesis genes
MEKNYKQKSTNCIRVVIYGPESTGKTTLVKDLARHYNTDYVREFSRDYLQKKWDKFKEKCTVNDLLEIVKGQIQNENKKIKKANKILFCDTNILATKVWSETHFNGYCHPLIKKYSKLFFYDIYILTQIDIPWEKDDLRDRPNNRIKMFNFFKKELDDNNYKYLIVSGNHEERMKQVISFLDKI